MSGREANAGGGSVAGATVSVRYPMRARAAQMLILCCAIWAFSFPAAKALQILGSAALPGNAGGSVFLASWLIVVRFGGAAVLLTFWIGRSLARMTWLEVKQGLGIGLFSGCGILLQFDGLAYTSGSISAFLTQGYCVWIPLFLAVRRWRLPGWDVAASCGLAILGAAILTGLSLENLRLGRGEWETLAGSVVFTGQILWLERPEFGGNDVMRFSWVMFVTMALVNLPVVAWTMPSVAALTAVYAAPLAWGLLVVMVLGCTLLAFVMMNRWQPRLPSTEAGLLYCTEPVFTSLLCLFLPGWLSAWGGIDYPNEVTTWRLVAGGALILAANGWLQLRPAENHG